MENVTVTKRGQAAIFAICPAAHVIALVSAGLITLFFRLKGQTELMRRLSAEWIHPLHQKLAWLTAKLPFSLAEFLYAAAIGGTLVYIIIELIRLILLRGKLRRIYRLCVRLLAFTLAVYAGFCVLWGVYYYGDDFIARSALPSGDVSAQQLERVTIYFADRLNAYGAELPRDEQGLCVSDRGEILAYSPILFREAERLYPCLAGPEIPAKGMFFSRIMSIIDFTGFFCPFTAEANVNTDFPVGLFAATVAHELSHQRGVAKEQEANFVAVLASLENGNPAYCYSACMLAYVHLGNALAGVDPAAYRLVYNGLSEGVRADLLENNRYWAQFETPVQTATNAVYEGFLQSYDQTLGMRSYGACVDLLVNYYDAAACEHFGLGAEK